jgi:hypothetical protein
MKRLALSALALIAMAISFRWSEARRSHPNPLEDVKRWHLTANSRESALGSDVISPDGKRLAFSDQKGIHVQQIDTAISRPLNERYRDLRDPPYPTVVAGVIGTAMIVTSMVATAFSLPPLMAKASAVQTVSVRPAFFTCALATKTSPAAGARRFTFSSTVRTSLSSGARVNAA